MSHKPPSESAKRLVDLSEPDQPSEHSDFRPVVGIDLGTTNSLIGVLVNDQPTILHDAHGRSVIPSAVLYRNGASNSQNPLVGSDAVNQSPAEGTLITSAKRLLGLSDQDFIRACRRAGYTADTSDGGQSIVTGSGSITAVEVSARILHLLWDLACAHFDRPPEACVITVPAYFSEKQRQAVRLAARLEGIEVLRLLDEPTAAALAYQLDPRQDRQILVYDLGGGTFDVSIIRLHQGIFEVLAIGGDDALGGDDFDHLIVDWLRRQVPDIDAELSTGALLGQVRALKEQLTTADQVSVQLPSRASELVLTRAQLIDMITPLLDRTSDLVEQAIADAGLTPDQIDRVVLAGGATQVPVVRARLTSMFGDKLLCSLDPEQVVARGATLHANQIAGNLEHHLLLGVVPLSLGIEIMGGMVEVILPRNQTLPISQTQSFTTQKNNQTGMKFHVVQGERELAEDCRSLARFELKGLPPAPAGMVKVDLKFTLDADGLLTARASEPLSGAQIDVEIQPSSGLDPERVEAMLLDSYRHAEDDHRQRLLGELRVEAERALNGLTDLLNKAEGLSDAERQTIEKQALKVRQGLSGEDYQALQTALTELNDLAAHLVQTVLDQSFTRYLAGRSVKP